MIHVSVVLVGMSVIIACYGVANHSDKMLMVAFVLSMAGAAAAAVVA